MVAGAGVEPAIFGLWAQNDFPFHSPAMVEIDGLEPSTNGGNRWT